ncbi:MAG TPA: hypothetical protein VNT58_05105 [Gaiellaceae bacterium]|nr:hypothetical protein [Gaiellaceae bacterium]
MTAIEERATGRSYEVLRGAVPQDAIEAALRHLHLDVVRNGLPPEWLAEWLWTAHWFPHLKWDAPIVSLLDHLPLRLRTGQLCDPQIVVQPPDEAEEVELVAHVDQEPEWANGRRYLRIVGVALTRNHARNGGLVVWPDGGSAAETPDLAPGDVVVMDPGLPHTSGLNREGAMRYIAYFRFLGE